MKFCGNGEIQERDSNRRICSIVYIGDLYCTAGCVYIGIYNIIEVKIEFSTMLCQLYQTWSIITLV